MSFIFKAKISLKCCFSCLKTQINQVIICRAYWGDSHPGPAQLHLGSRHEGISDSSLESMMLLIETCK